MVTVALELDEIQDLLDVAPVRELLVLRSAEEHRIGDNIGAHPRMARDQEVVKDAHVCKELAVLEGARHAKRGDGVRLHAGELAIRKADRAARRPINPAHAIEH